MLACFTLPSSPGRHSITCSHWLWLCGAPFSPWRGSCSCGPPFRFLLFWGGFDLVVLSLPSFVLVSLLRSLSGSALLGSRCCRCEASAIVPFGVSPFVLCSPVWLGPFACVLFVWRLLAPLLPVFASLPPAVGPVWCPGPVCTLVPPSGYLVASVTAWLPCYLLGVWQCFVVLTSLCLMAAKASGPVWGVLHPLHHVASAVRLLSFTTLRYSSL